MPDGTSSTSLLQDMPPIPNLPFVKPEDYQYFAPLLKEDEERPTSRPTRRASARS